MTIAEPTMTSFVPTFAELSTGLKIFPALSASPKPGYDTVPFAPPEVVS